MWRLAWHVSTAARIAVSAAAATVISGCPLTILPLAQLCLWGANITSVSACVKQPPICSCGTGLPHRVEHISPRERVARWWQPANGTPLNWTATTRPTPGVLPRRGEAAVCGGPGRVTRIRWRMPKSARLHCQLFLVHGRRTRGE